MNKLNMELQQLVIKNGKLIKNSKKVIVNLQYIEYNIIKNRRCSSSSRMSPVTVLTGR